MKSMFKAGSFQKELEAVFSECEQNIQSALKDYEKDIRGAIETIKKDCLSRTHHA